MTCHFCCSFSRNSRFSLLARGCPRLLVLSFYGREKEPGTSPQALTENWKIGQFVCQLQSSFGLKISHEMEVSCLFMQISVMV